VTPQKNPKEDPYGYDPATDTLRVSRHALARLLIQFRIELERDPAREWSHMGDFDISFEQLADAVDHARTRFRPELRQADDGRPDDRMRCKRAPGYRWPDDQPPYNGQPIEAFRIRAVPSRGESHYAQIRGDFGEALCGLTFTREDGVTPVTGQPSCPVCVREKRLADQLPRE
jgi:hypothetical protein